MANVIFNFNGNNEISNSNEVYLDLDCTSQLSVTQKPTKKTEDKWLAYLISEGIDPRYVVTSELTQEQQAKLLMYYDRPLDFEQELKIWQLKNSCRVNKNVDIKAVQTALHNIFTWIPGERILNPEFGTKLRRMLYEGLTNANVENIIAEIRNAITMFEPRVKVESIKHITEMYEKEDNTVHLQIIYTIPGLSDQTYAYDYIANKSAE